MASPISRSVPPADGSYSAVSGNGPNGPTQGGDSPSCCQHFQGWITSIFKSIGQFFVHRYADLHMFGRAWTSMGGDTDSQEIERRIGELERLATALRHAQDDHAGPRVYNRFNALSQRSRDLFYYTRSYYINHLQPVQMTESRAEMLRECEQVISFQRTMTAVNTFYRVFTGRISTPQPSDSHADENPVRHPDSVPNSNNPLPQNGGIPGTAVYRRNAIPADIQQKAQEIARLKANYDDANLPAALNYFKCPNSMEIMTLPVFDASHPAVQNESPAIRAALAAGTPLAGEQADARNLRHIHDAESLEQWYTRNRREQCSLCRHGGNRASLKIDTALQDEILAFLRRLPPSGAPASRRA